MSLGHELKLVVLGDQALKQCGHLNASSYMLLQAVDAVRAYDEPQLQRSESSAQRHLPMHVINGHARVLMLQKQWRHRKCLQEWYARFHPQACAVKIDHEP